MHQAEEAAGPCILAIHGCDRETLRRKRQPTHFADFDARHLKDKDPAVFDETSPPIEGEPRFLAHGLAGIQKSPEALADRFLVVIHGDGEAESGGLLAELAKKLQGDISMISRIA
jgi:hypothetical protein